MKGGKDEEKNMSPMFPRLHVSDAEKGGPRAPPRNKMALYEQLSIPSQRFNPGSAPTLLGSRNNAGHVASVSQGVGHERTAFPPFYIPPTAVDSDDNIHSQSSDGMHLRTKVHNSEPKSANYRTSNASVHLASVAECGPFPPSNSKNSCPTSLANDNDFSVPNFVIPGTTSSNKNQHNVDRKRLTPLSPIHPSRSTETSGNSTQKAPSATCNSSTHLHSARDKHLKRTNTTDLWSRQHIRNHSEENLVESVTSKDCAERTVSHTFTHDKIAEYTPASQNQEHLSSAFDDLGGLHDKHNNGHGNCNLTEQVAPTGKGNILQVRNEFRSRASLGDGRESCNENRGQIQGLVQVTDVDRNDDTSETSMVDSISAFDISPDDVVGVIGQKHFWKARRAIVNQQRLFSVQVFELHRLIKVQKLIAGSPHLLLEDTAYLTKPSIKASPAKKLSPEYILKPSLQIVKPRSDSQNPNRINERAVENAVTKPPLPSVSGIVNGEHVNQQSSHGNPTPPPVTDSWSFQPPPGNQWLVPVMSPSEGLVYKPYAGSCPPTAVYGGCGPMMGGEFPSPYGIPAPHHPGMGNPQFAQPYFSPYAMPMMTPVMSASSFEHANPYAGGQSRGHAEQISTGEVNRNMHSRASRNISNQKSEAISAGFPKFQTFKDSDIQGSTASSPGDRAHREVAGSLSEGRNALSLFPMPPAVQNQDEVPDTQNSDQQLTRAIKVVPHNSRSATESAARIFQSIQEERQQYDS